MTRPTVATLAAQVAALEARLALLEANNAPRPTHQPRSPDDYPDIDHRGRRCRINGNVRSYPATP